MEALKPPEQPVASSRGQIWLRRIGWIGISLLLLWMLAWVAVPPLLKYLSISTKESPEVVEYPDSSKYLAMASGPLDDAGGVQVFDRIHRAKDDLDYWDGEP